MKKILLLTSSVALMFAAGSCQKEIDHLAGDVNVTFEVSAGEVATRAIADGTNVNVLHWEIYKTDDLQVATNPLGEASVIDNDRDKNFTVDLKLLADQKYTIIFWAEVNGAGHYGTGDLRNVSINTTKEIYANDESRAAFYRRYDFETKNGETVKETLYLSRPFAQINLGATNLVTSFNNVNGGMVRIESTEMTVTNVAASFNTIDGIGIGDQTLTFVGAATPNGEKDNTDKILEVNELFYYWLGMNYIIVSGGERDNVKVDVSIFTNFGTVNHSVSSVPVEKNYRTNLLGDFLTTGARFNVVVDERFQKPDIVEHMAAAVVQTADDLQTAINAIPDGTEGMIQLGGNVDLGTLASFVSTRASHPAAGIVIPASKNVIVDLNGFTISQTLECSSSYSMMDNNGRLTIKDSKGNGRISFKDGSAGGSSSWGSYIVNNKGTLIVESGVLEHLGSTNFTVRPTNIPIQNYAGKVTVNGGTISSADSRSLRDFTAGGEIEINGGTFLGQVWMQGLGNGSSSLVIKGGNFSPVYGYDSSSVFITNGTNVINVSIEGGYFNTKIGSTDPSKEGVAGCITGGTFLADPSAYVSDECTVSEVDGVWTVCPKDNADSTSK